MIVLAALAAGMGATWLLADLPWFRPDRTAQRVMAYSPSPSRWRPMAESAASPSLVDVARASATRFAARAGELVGTSDEAEARLRRIHSPLDITAFRLRQVGWAGVGLVAGAAAGTLLHREPALAVMAIAGGPVVGFLAVDQQLAKASDAWKRRLFLELPVVSEQLGILLGAGYSLSGALARIAARGRGACGRDVQQVCTRMQHGLTEIDALREWSSVAQVESLDRLVAVLALNRDAGDIGHLVAQEARAMRRDAQRIQIAAIERRAQQVWIPVTVATLVPGVIFLAVPFVAALRQFSTP